MFAGRFSSSIGLVGVDFGATSVKLLQLREQGQSVHVVGAARCEAPAEQDEAPAGPAMTQQLRTAFAAGGFTGRRCVVSLPREDVGVQSIRLPKMPDHELRQAAGWEAAQRFGFRREDMQSDWIRTGALLQSGEAREEVLIIAASHEAIHQRIDPLIEAGLRPVAIDTCFTAMARAFGRRCRRESDRGQVRAVLEVGASGSVVMILRGDQIAFCKPIDIGGRRFNQAVAEHLQMEETAAAELREARIAAAIRQGGADAALDPSTDRAVHEAVRPLMNDLAKEVMLCLRYYGVTFRGHPPDPIILTGGDGLEPRLDKTLLQSCSTPVVFDDAAGTLGAIVGQVYASLNRSPGPAGAWAVAAGLSLRGINIGRASKSTMPAPTREGSAAA